MNLSRINYLRKELEAECIDSVELAEIEEAFAEIPDKDLSDLRENAMACNMLDELEARVSPVERIIYDWVNEHFGESEANEPSWDIKLLAKEINSKLNLNESINGEK